MSELTFIADEQVKNLVTRYGSESNDDELVADIRDLIGELSKAQTRIKDQAALLNQLLAVMGVTDKPRRLSFTSGIRLASSSDETTEVKDAILMLAENIASENGGLVGTDEIESAYREKYPNLPQDSIRIRAGNFLNRSGWKKTVSGQYRKV
jgi:hypothetical protein